MMLVCGDVGLMFRAGRSWPRPMWLSHLVTSSPALTRGVSSSCQNARLRKYMCSHRTHGAYSSLRCLETRSFDKTPGEASC